LSNFYKSNSIKLNTSIVSFKVVYRHKRLHFDRSDLTPYFLLISPVFFSLGDHIFIPFKRHSASVKSFLWTCLAMILLGDGLVFKNAAAPAAQKNLFGGFMIAAPISVLVIVAGITVMEAIKANNKRPKQAATTTNTTVNVEIAKAF
jgi:hypothetical protein